MEVFIFSEVLKPDLYSFRFLNRKPRRWKQIEKKLKKNKSKKRNEGGLISFSFDVDFS